MANNKADYTLTFRRLAEIVEEGSKNVERVSSLFEDPAAFDDWCVDWRKRLATDERSHAERRSDMRAVNPAFIPRNHLIEEVIVAAVEKDGGLVDRAQWWAPRMMSSPWAGLPGMALPGVAGNRGHPLKLFESGPA